MRLIINTRMFSSINYKLLSANQRDALFQIAEFIFDSNSEQKEGSVAVLSALTGLSKDEVKAMEGEKKGFFQVSEGVVTWLNPSISFFKNNNANVKKCIARKKAAPQEVAAIEPVAQPVQVEEKPKKADNTDWDGITEAFNTTFKDYPYVSLVQSMTDKRKQSVKKIYELAKKQKDPITGEKNEFEDIHDFCEQYFILISGLNGVKKSWMNQGGNKMFQFDFDFFFNAEKYVNITEKGKYK